MSDQAKKRGAALVVVLLLLAIMSIMVAEFGYAVRIQATILANHEGRVRARAAARAGQNAAAGLLARTDPDNPTVFNNPSTGIMLFRYQCITEGSADVFLAMAGGAGLDDLTDANQAPASPEPMGGGTAAQSGCGLWSLGLPYQLRDANLDIEIQDEQSRLNLNAMVKGMVQGEAEAPEVSFALDRVQFCAVYELIRHQAFMRRMQITDADLFEMTTAILDYLDYGKIDGAFDRDQITTFEVGDDFIPMKDGPLDTVDEIRMAPGMTDELYAAVADYLTVYPTSFNAATPLASMFSGEVNLNAAPLEVVFALVRASASSGDRCESTLSEEEAMKLANRFVQSNFPGTAASGPGAAQLTTAGDFRKERDLGVLPDPVRQLMAKPQANGMRFFRVRVNAVMPEGQEMTVTRVVKRFNGRIVPLYYREE